VLSRCCVAATVRYIPVGLVLKAEKSPSWVRLMDVEVTFSHSQKFPVNFHVRPFPASLAIPQASLRRKTDDRKVEGVTTTFSLYTTESIGTIVFRSNLFAELRCLIDADANRPIINTLVFRSVFGVAGIAMTFIYRRNIKMWKHYS